MCRIITLDDKQVESTAWNNIRTEVSTDSEADSIFNDILSDDFMNWYGEDWTRSGIEPTITNKGIQNLIGTDFRAIKEFKPSSELESKLTSFIKQAGVSINLVDAVKARLGDNVNAVVNFLDKTLDLVEGRINETALPKEAAHIYTEYLQQQESDLFYTMYDRIASYPEYKQVKEDYSNEYGDNEELYRKEAIGKVIASRIISNTAPADTFLKLAWKRILESLKKAFNINSAQFKDMFDIAADNILNSTKHFQIRPSDYKLFQVESKSNQDKVNKLISEDALLSKRVELNPEDGEYRDFYVRLGKEVKYRATQIVKTKQNFNKKFTEEQKKVNKKKADTGTKLHDYANNITQRYLAKISGKPVPEKLKGVDDQAYRALEDYLLNIFDLPQFKNADILTEVKIYDTSRDLAGTIDLLLIDKDGFAHILDYKFIGVEPNKKLYIKPYKRKEWDEQLKIYKSILSKAYGINKFGMMRMLPIAAEYDENTNFNKIIIDGKDVFAKAVAGSEERTGNESIDTIINSMYATADKINKNKRLTNEEKEVKLKAIENTINQLKVKQDLKSFELFINNELAEVEEVLKQDTVNESDVVKMFHISDYYSNIDIDLDLPELKPIAEKARGLSTAFKQQLGIWARGKNLVFDYMKSVQSVLTNAVTLGSIENPVFQYANRLIQSAQDKKDKEVTSLINKFKSYNIDSFDSIIDKTEGMLIKQYNPEFYDKVKTADSKWIKDNVVIRETITINGKEVNTKDDFIARLRKKEEQLSKLSPDIKEQELEVFRRYNDMWSEKYKNIAISNFNGSHKYIRPSEKWYSEEYKALRANQDSDLYKFYIDIQNLIEEANLYSNKRLDSRFLPSIEKSMLRKLGQNGFNPKVHVQEFADSFKIHNYDINEKVKELQINYTGTLDPTKKSYELKETFTLFAESVYNVKYMSEIEDALYLSEQFLKQGTYIKLDNIGNPIVDDVSGSYIKVSGEKTKESDDTVKYFNKFIESYVYNIKHNADTAIAGFGVNKVLGGLLNYNALLKIGGNVLSATSNLVGGNANQIVEAAKGRFFNTSELGKGKKGFWSRDAKSMAIIGYFDVSTDNTIFKKSRELRVSALDRHFNSDWLMSLQNVTEKEIQYTTLLAYTHGMTLKDGKIVKKGKDDKSLYDMIELKDGVVTMPDLSDSLYGRVKLTVTELNSRLTGAKYARGKMLYEGDIRLKALSQFKSWMLPMTKERFGSLTYNDNLGLYEEGRARAVFGALFTKHYKPVALGYLKSLVTFNTRAAVIGAEEALLEKYNTLIAINPNFNPDINKESGITFEEYKALYEENVKSFLREMLLWSTMVIAGASYASTDDDDKNKTVVKYMTRFKNELAFFYSLDSYLALGGVTIPLITTASDFIKFTDAVIDESWSLASGDSELLAPGVLRKRASKIVIGLHQYDKVHEELTNLMK